MIHQAWDEWRERRGRQQRAREPEAVIRRRADRTSAVFLAVGHVLGLVAVVIGLITVAIAFPIPTRSFDQMLLGIGATLTVGGAILAFASDYTKENP